jgi:hypothetical protein
MALVHAQSDALMPRKLAIKMLGEQTKALGKG